MHYVGLVLTSSALLWPFEASLVCRQLCVVAVVVLNPRQSSSHCNIITRMYHISDNKTVFYFYFLRLSPLSLFHHSVVPPFSFHLRKTHRMEKFNVHSHTTFGGDIFNNIPKDYLNIKHVLAGSKANFVWPPSSSS